MDRHNYFNIIEDVYKDITLENCYPCLTPHIIKFNSQQIVCSWIISIIYSQIQLKVYFTI